ncbi:MAG TPA: hypothetical protein VK085_11315 [Pseudogracilibacillus sp.]|nr:hypothetical protein [Pseudogracilibacillus sp.]
MSLSNLQKKLIQLEDDLDKTHQKIKELFEEKQHIPTNDHVYCYFNHSLILEHEKNKSRLIMGNFHIKNMSDQVKNLPIILIKITSQGDFRFTGKFQTENQRNTKGFQWERIMLKNLDPKNHFCLKPINTEQLDPNELLSFQNFQIKIPLDAAIIVEGFVYFDESNDGVPAINAINIGV